MRFAAAMVLAGTTALIPNVVSAQTDDSRFYLNLNGAFEPGSQTYADDGTFRLYDETGRLSVSSEVSSGAVLDFAAGAKVTGGFTVGLGFHRTSSSDPATVTGTAPHPVFFDRPRAFSQSLDALTRSEQALHISLGYIVSLGEKLDLHITAGPSQFRFSQQVPASVTISETGSSFATVQATVATEDRKRNAWGGHIGADLSYAIFESGAASFRLGGFVRYAAAKSEFLVVSNTASTELGGVQIGAGLRVRF
jgi:hypothetical protein